MLRYLETLERQRQQHGCKGQFDPLCTIFTHLKKSPPYLVDGFEALQLDTGLHQSSGKVTGLNVTERGLLQFCLFGIFPGGM